MQHDWHSDCARLLEAARQSVAWANDPGNEKVLGPERAGVDKGLRRLVTEVAKLGRSIDRPGCVGVFGPSQVGKSYLVSILASGQGQPFKVQFGSQPPLDFLRDINPAGGAESTGVVTRFSCRAPAVTDDYPVCLRLLSEIEIVKILGNSFFLDNLRRNVVAPAVEEIRRVVAEAQARRLSAPPGDNALTIEDIWDLQDYFERSFEGMGALDGLRAVWDDLADLAPALQLADRATLFALLWGQLPQFTRLYLDLVGALSRLGFPEHAFCPIAALVPRTESLINVETLAGLGKAGQAELDIRGARGPAIRLPRAVVTALAAELNVPIPTRPWPFLENTDLLDFPGARERMELDLPEYLADPNKNALSELFLRGKVGYLFERYAAEQEITSLLLCLKPSTQEVTDLPKIISRWVATTHGATPDKRAGKPVTLFLLLTWFDVLFSQKAGEDDADPGERFRNRLSSAIESYFAKGHDWPGHWTPNAPFSNVYWYRNTSCLATGLFHYDETKRETGFLPGMDAYVAHLRQGYLQVPTVQRYFREPARAFDEGLRLNDGGIGYLAENLAPVCRPDVKLQQIRTRFEALRDQLANLVERFHVSTDVEKRLQERRDVSTAILTHAWNRYAENRFADLLAALQCSEHLISEVLYGAYTRQSTKTPGKVLSPPLAPAVAATTPGLPPIPGRPPVPGMPAVPGRAPANPPMPATGGAAAAPGAGRSIVGALARAAVEFWMDRLRTASETDAIGQFFPGDPAMARELAHELCAAARRTSLEAAVAAAIERMGGSISDSIDMVLEKAAFASCTVINRFVTRFYFEALPPNQRPLAPLEDGSQVPLFTRPPPANCARELALTKGSQGVATLSFWMYGFHALVEENAKSLDGLQIDIDRNAALGAILERARALASPGAGG